MCKKERCIRSETSLILRTKISHSERSFSHTRAYAYMYLPSRTTKSIFSLLFSQIQACLKISGCLESICKRKIEHYKAFKGFPKTRNQRALYGVCEQKMHLFTLSKHHKLFQLLS